MDNNIKVPKRRFRGMDGEWGSQKLGALASKVTTKNGGKKYVETLTNSAEQGIIGQREYFEHDVSNIENIDGYYIVEDNDFVYNPRISSTAPVGPVNRNKLGRTGVMSPLYTVFKTHDVDESYLEWFFKSSHWHKFMYLNGDTGARADRFAIKDTVFFEMPIPTPDIEEQIKVGGYLMKLDNLIGLHQRKINKMQNLKKAYLSEMFPKPGAKIPRRRFKWFTGDWVQRKFSDIAETRRGVTYKPTDVNEGGIRVLRSSNINDDLFEVHEDDVFVNINAVNIPYTKNGDILITSANGSNRLVGKHTIVKGIEENSTVHGGFMLIASSDEPEFVNASMSSAWYTNFIKVFVAGGNGAIGNLNKKDLDEQDVLVPCREERDRIGSFFSNLDNLITLHQRKLAKLQALKKAYLTEMFP